ncbi:unnamed protein product [Dovyalis caffra]|uniref:Uncharacterized protein n=1 Tax=Dovyalis caffra TaxID=77055 RepID=A0AAV1RH25_9ROSI|nr:unnamed protein product [Dovyalis caffra]
MVRTSPDPEVKKRKNSECGKHVKKKKLKEAVHELHAIREDNEQIKSEKNFMIQNLQLMQVGIEQQKAEFCVSQNKAITAQENIVETLWQELLTQHLMAGSNQLEVAAQCSVSSLNAGWDDRMPSKAKQSSDCIIELKHRQMVLKMKIDLLCKMIINDESKKQA